jgi:hypothetical protein
VTDGIERGPFVGAPRALLFRRCGDLGRAEGGQDLLRESIQVFQSELGYMLANPQRFAGHAAYRTSATSFSELVPPWRWHMRRTPTRKENVVCIVFGRKGLGDHAETP